VQATYAGQVQWQLREISGGDGYTTAPPLYAHFGLGDATNITTLRIEWPSGIVQELYNQGVNAIRTIEEPNYRIMPKSQVVSEGADVVFEVSPVGDTRQWFRNGHLLVGETETTLLLADVTFEQAGRYHVEVRYEGRVEIVPANLEVDPGLPSFTKVKTGAVVEDVESSAGFGWLDYDNDGDLDLIVASNPEGTSQAHCSFYQNDGLGGFGRITSGTIVEKPGWYGAVVCGDYDNDGDTDIFLANGQLHQGTQEPDDLLRNEGNGHFTDLVDSTPAQGVAHTLGGAWFDYNNDGFLDLIVPNTTWQTSGTDFFYENNRDGTFRRMLAGELGDLLNTYGNTEEVNCIDVNNDGWLDVFLPVGQVGAQNVLHLNNGDGTFSRTDTGSLALDTPAYRATWADYDNDGYLDVYLETARSNNPATPGIGTLYRSIAGETFVLVNDTAGIPANASWRGAAWGDFDNDGWIDLFLPGDSRSSQARSFLLRNNRDGTFESIEGVNPVTDLVVLSGSSGWADLDNDGDLDLFVSNGNTVAQPNYLYLNRGNENHWLMVNPRGTVSNASAIGARVIIEARIWGTTVSQTRDIGCGGLGQSSDDPRAHFGLGDAEIIDTIRIEWPGPAFTVQELHDVPVDQTLEVVEPPQLTAEVTGEVELTVPGWIGTTYQLQVSSDLGLWEPLATLTITDPAGGVTYTDDESPQGQQRFYRVVRQDD
jgi:hypothetical protein